MARTPCTIWFIDDHWGNKPPTLESADGERTEKLVYIPRASSSLALSYRSQIPVGEAHFTAEAAVDAALGWNRAKREHATNEVQKRSDAIQHLLEIKEGLDADG